MVTDELMITWRAYAAGYHQSAVCQRVGIQYVSTERRRRAMRNTWV